MTSSFRSPTAVSSHSATPLFTDEYLRDGLSEPLSDDGDDGVDDVDCLPRAFSLSSSTSPAPSPSRAHAAASASADSESDEEDGVAHLPVDELTSAQLREIQGELTASLSKKANLSTLHQAAAAARAGPSRASSAAPTQSLSSLHAQLASKETDLFIAAALGSALSDRNEQLEASVHDLARRLATSEASVAVARSTLSSASTDSVEAEELTRTRAQLQRALQRQQLSESHYKEALSTAKKTRREVAERAKREQHEGKLREAELQSRLLEAEEQLRRVMEDSEHLRAVEEERVKRERQLRRSRELKVQAEEEERRKWREEREKLDGAVEDLERRLREDGRRREEVERRCGALEKQREEAVAALREATLEMERRKRRWEELDRARSQSTQEAIQRQRQQLQTLTQRMRHIEEETERERGGGEGSQAASAPSAREVQRATPASSSFPSTSSSSVLSPFISLTLGPLAAVPAEVPTLQTMLRRREAASTPSTAAVYPFSVHLIASPSPFASLPLTPSESSLPSVPAASAADAIGVALDVKRSLEGELRLSEHYEDEQVQAMSAAVEAFSGEERQEEMEEAGLKLDRLLLEAIIEGDAALPAVSEMSPSSASTPPAMPAAAATLPSPSLSTFVASPLSYLQPQSFHTRTVAAAGPIRATRRSSFDALTSTRPSLSTHLNGAVRLGKDALPIQNFAFPFGAPLALSSLPSSALHLQAGVTRQSGLLCSSTSTQVQQAFSTLLHTRLSHTLRTRSSSEAGVRG